MKKFLIVIIVIMICLFSYPAYAQEAEPEFRSYILIDSESGQIISENNPDEVINDTGLSQMMTIYILFDALNRGDIKFDDEVTVSKNAANAKGPQMFLDEGATYTVDELLYGACMVAASDAITALCEKLSGDEQSFINLMNAQALKIGMNNTVFTSVDGYETIGETTCAYDISLLALKMSELPEIFDYTSVWQYTITHQGGRNTDLVNANRLVKTQNNCDGLGVGSNSNAGYSIIAAKNSGESKFILIGLGAKSSKSRFEASDNLLNYAANAFVTKTFVKEGQIVKKDFIAEGGPEKEVALCAEKEISLLLKIGEEELCEKEFIMHDNISLPLKAGDTVGEIVITLGGKVAGKTNVVVTQDIMPLTFESSFKKILKCWLGINAA